MENIHRNVILDLLPAYIAGEASEETKVLVEEFANKDPQIARLIRTGKIEIEVISEKLPVPDDLEMKTIKRVRRSIRRQMLYVALATASILMVPLIAMQFSNEVNWSAFDFIVMGVLLSGTGLTYILISRISDNLAYKIAVGIAVVTGFFLIWVNLAVGIIGSENNPANLLYFGVYIIGFIGAGISRFQAKGMARTLFITAIYQMLIPVIAMIIWMPSLDDPPGIIGVFIFNLFFALLFIGSGLLFRHAAYKQVNS